MKIVKVSYGRTIEVGKFGHGRPYGKVWFGWEAECEEGEEDRTMNTLGQQADAQEKIERKEFDERNRGGVW